jgi:hypothetical protein
MKQVKKRDEIRITKPSKRLLIYIEKCANAMKRSVAAQAEFMLEYAKKRGIK